MSEVMQTSPVANERFTSCVQKPAKQNIHLKHGVIWSHAALGGRRLLFWQLRADLHRCQNAAEALALA